VGHRLRAAKSRGFSRWHHECFSVLIAMTSLRKLLLVTASALALCGLQACASESDLNPQPLPPEDPRDNGKEGSDTVGGGSSGSSGAAPTGAADAGADGSDGGGGGDGAAPDGRDQ